MWYTGGLKVCLFVLGKPVLGKVQRQLSGGRLRFVHMYLGQSSASALMPGGNPSMFSSACYALPHTLADSKFYNAIQMLIPKIRISLPKHKIKILWT